MVLSYYFVAFCSSLFFLFFFVIAYWYEVMLSRVFLSSFLKKDVVDGIK